MKIVDDCKDVIVSFFYRVRGPLLFSYLCQKEEYTEGEVSNYMCQLISALAWLHSKNIAHLDIKVCTYSVFVSSWTLDILQT